MTLAEEKDLLARFAKRAGGGEMLNIHDLKAAYEQAFGTPPATAPSIIFCTGTAGANSCRVRFIPDAIARRRTPLKKPFSSRCEQSPPRRRQAAARY